jgi:predicted dehydrogenase
MEQTRWGIVGTGRMAAVMAAEIATLQVAGQSLTAVASRQRETGLDFARCHGIARVHRDAAELAADPDVDAVYVATPHSRHADDMLDCIERGKAVLCEKPFTLNAVEAARVVAAAKARRVFVMEAMWTRFLPAVAAMRDALAANAIGPVHMVVGGGAFIPNVPAGHYLFERSLGGGALLDAGVYLVSLTSLILGAPGGVHAFGRIGPRGVDEQEAIVLDYPSGADAVLYLSLRTRRSPDLEVLGADGRLRLAAPVFRPEKLTLWTASAGEVEQHHPIAGSGYGLQVLAVAAALRAGATECEAMPPAESLAIMRTLDAVRAQIGLRYPNEAR